MTGSWEPFPKPLEGPHPWLEPPRPCVSAGPLPRETDTEGFWYQSNATSLAHSLLSFFFSRMIHSLFESTQKNEGSHPSSQSPLRGPSPSSLHRKAITEIPLKRPTLHLSIHALRMHRAWQFSKFLKLPQLRAALGFKDRLPNKMRQERKETRGPSIRRRRNPSKQTVKTHPENALLCPCWLSSALSQT